MGKKRASKGLQDLHDSSMKSKYPNPESSGSQEIIAETPANDIAKLQQSFQVERKKTKGSHLLMIESLGSDDESDPKFGRAPTQAQTFVPESEVQRKIRIFMQKNWNSLGKDSYYTIRDRFTLTANYLQNDFPRRVISLPTMQLIGMEPIRRRLEPALDEWILKNADSFKNRGSNTEAVLQGFLQESSKFAILSHRWSNDEMTFQDLGKLSRITEYGINAFLQQQESDKVQYTSAETIDKLAELSGGQTRSPQEPPLLSQLTTLLPHILHCTGLVKLINFCALALNSYKCEMAWIDTCCIDKTSSAELDEAIRSMFRWYRCSAVCIVHLAETETKDWPGSTKTPDLWFSRGWTLQELLAPHIVKFYSSSWEELTTTSNDKSNELLTSVMRHPRQDRQYYSDYKGKSIVDWLSEVTQVPVKDLLDFQPGLGNLRQRLRWSSERSTTRVEDAAYCLLGIFNISLSIAYGEGDISFYRFQQAIMERSNDRSLFQWFGRPSTLSSMLAKEPQCFHHDSAPIDADALDPSSILDPTFTFTNNGLRISVSLVSKEFSVNWINARLNENDLQWENIREAGKEIQQAFRFAILGYCEQRPVPIMLIEEKIRGHICYLRYAAPHENIDLPVDELVSNAGKPEIIYIR